MPAVRDDGYCAASQEPIGDAEVRVLPTFGLGWVQCPSCERVLVPTPTGKFRLHLPAGPRTLRLDQRRNILWHYAGDPAADQAGGQAGQGGE